MSKRVNLYDNAYANYGSEVYREVRNETYGEDFGQTSRVTNEESKEIPRLLGLKPDSFVLEVGAVLMDTRCTLRSGGIKIASGHGVVLGRLAIPGTLRV